MMTVEEIKARHPMPWRYALVGNVVQIFDASGRELPMFVMLDFMCVITQRMASAPVQG